MSKHLVKKYRMHLNKFHPQFFPHHLWLCLMWLIIGLGLRLTNLTGKPPWTDEFSTLVFSLGNSFLSVPLDQAITAELLLQPLQPQSTTNFSQVWLHLSHETNHPPLYFLLAHWWMQLFPTSAGLVSLWGARSLQLFLGAISIPAIYGLSWLSFRSVWTSQLTAAMMAVSPYGIFLAQEARHYTLAILWVIASLSCLVIVSTCIQGRKQLPLWIALIWIIINALGIATHYFFALTLGAEVLVLIALAQTQKQLPFFPPWWRIYASAIGTAIAGIVWLPIFLENTYGSKLTEWIQHSQMGFAWLNPFFQAFAAWVTMLYLLPIETPHLAIIITSGLVMLIFLIWAAPILVRGFKINLEQPQTRFITQIFVGIVVGAIALFFIFTYFLGIDLTRGARYNFVYFPAVIVLLGASLGMCWHPPSELLETGQQIGRWGINGKKAVALIWLMGFASAITVVCNYGYQKYYRPDLLVQLIGQTSSAPVLIATSQTTHVQIGETMGIARELKIQNPKIPSFRFLLAHQDQDSHSSTIALENTFRNLPRPFDLWLVNFHAPPPISVQECVSESRILPSVNGYDYKIYHCP